MMTEFSVWALLALLTVPYSAAGHQHHTEQFANDHQLLCST